MLLNISANKWLTNAARRKEKDAKESKSEEKITNTDKLLGKTIEEANNIVKTEEIYEEGE